MLNEKNIGYISIKVNRFELISYFIEKSVFFRGSIVFYVLQVGL